VRAKSRRRRGGRKLRRLGVLDAWLGCPDRLKMGDGKWMLMGTWESGGKVERKVRMQSGRGSKGAAAR
jgi:hypothetical protein